MWRRTTSNDKNANKPSAPAPEPIWYPAIAAAKIGPKELKYVEVGPQEEPICLINLDGEFYALNDCCTHEDASLSDGEISGDEIECPLHGGAFEIKTGMPASFPVVVPAKTYPVRVTDEGMIEIGLPGR